VVPRRVIIAGMIEVHTGAKPGRPALLLFVSAGALVVALALAWSQMLAARALQPPVHIKGTPLLVRAPKDWVQHEDEPRVFFLPAERGRWGRDRQVVGRSLTVQWGRQDAFAAPEEFLAYQDHSDAMKSFDLEPARIGPLSAIQVRRAPLGGGRAAVAQQTILRVACSPRGELIRVEYRPLAGLSYADFDLLDDFCAAIQIDDPAYALAPDELHARAGVRFKAAPNWRLVGPELTDVAGLYVLGTENGLPAWSLAVFRTWLSGGRTARDLLLDHATQRWQLDARNVAIEERSRAAGGIVWSLHPKASDAWDQANVSVRVIESSAAEAALVFAYAGRAHAAQADHTADQLAEQMEFLPTARVPDIAAAEAAGISLAAEITSPAALPAAWGREPQRAFFLGEGTRGAEALATHYAAVHRDPDSGYEGGLLNLYEDSKMEANWTVDARAQGFSYTLEYYRGTRFARVQARVRERRAGDSRSVTRVSDGRRERGRSETYEIGPAFICPPAESVAYAWAATRDPGAWIIESSTVLGPGTHTELLQTLAPDEDGVKRVLIQVDYWPAGILLGFDDDGELRYEIRRNSRFDRVEQREALRQFPQLANWP